MGSAAPRLTDPAGGAAPRASWPGALVARALALLAADFRRPTGPVAVAAVLALAAVLARTTQAGPFSPALAGGLGFLATAPIAVIRRFPGSAIGVVLAASAMFVIFGRLSWSAAAVAGWLIALAACPVVLRRRPAILAVAATEVAVLLATRELHRNATPWDATAAEALAVIAAWGAGELLRARRQSALDQAAAAAQLRQLSERDVAARERASIARELHDVVAHHVSMIAVRAATAPCAITGLPDPGRAAFGEIAHEARTALLPAVPADLLAPAVTSRLIAEFAARARPVPSPELDRLTPRERQVLLLVASGLTNAEIAARLCLAGQTVKSHVSSVLFKLELRDRVQAVILAYESGVVVPGAPSGQQRGDPSDGARPGPW